MIHPNPDIEAAAHEAARYGDPSVSEGYMMSLARKAGEEITRTEARELLKLARAEARENGRHRRSTEVVYPEFPCTDLGNAERLVHHFGALLRYDASRKRWLDYDGRRWAHDETGTAMRYAKETARLILDEAGAAEDTDRRSALAKWGLRSEAEARLRAMLSLAETEEGIPVTTSQLDRDPWRLNVLNGTIDLRTGELHPHSPGDLITKLAPVEYDPDASAPIFDRFLLEIMAGSQEMASYLARAVGYSLAGMTTEQVLFLLHGMGENGKSTLIELFLDLLGDYSQSAPFSTFLTQRNDTVRNDLARLAGSRFVSAIESEAGQRLAEPVVKQLTGSDTVTARFLYGEYFEFRPQFALWLTTNHRPVIRDQTRSMWRRIHLVPFTRSFPPSERDPQLPKKLREELPGVLAWAVRGCLEWQRLGLQPPTEVQAATEEYRDEMDSLGGFFRERVVVDSSAEVGATELYEAYREWAEKAGERVQSQTVFGRRLSERGFPSEKRGTVRRMGLRLRTEMDRFGQSGPEIRETSSITPHVETSRETIQTVQNRPEEHPVELDLEEDHDDS